MKRLSSLLLTASLLLLAGCGEDEESFSRYPSVSVPYYGVENYIRDLSESSPELVYNATCRLSPHAKKFGKTLCAEDADADSPEYKTAKTAYTKVSDQLESKETAIVAASLRFFQLFNKEYKLKEELIGIVTRVESSNPQVQYEQVTLLRSLASEKSSLPEPLLHRLLDSPSWIVSRTTYGLISRLPDHPLRQELVNRYLNTDEERERLIIIVALNQQLRPEEARLFEQEMLATDNPKLRSATGATLVNNVHCPGVKQWLMDHYTQFSDEEKACMFDECEDEDLALWFVTQGFIPEDSTLKTLAQGLLTEEEDLRAMLVRFEEAVQSNPQLVVRWTAMKDKVKREAEQRDAFQKELTPAVDAFIDAAKLVLVKSELPEADQKKLAKQLINTGMASLADAM
jgi:hypothetical protein